MVSRETYITNLLSAPAKTTADTVVIAITGIHGNFYSNPFYYNIGNTLRSENIDFIYAQTNNAFPQIQSFNVKTQSIEMIGSYNERFSYTLEDIAAYIDFAEEQGYKHIILAGHSMGANKVLYYLATTQDKRIEHFLLLSPADLTYMMQGVTNEQKTLIRALKVQGLGNKKLPFLLMGWVDCLVDTAYDWISDIQINNVPVSNEATKAMFQNICHTGALLIGTYDTFTAGNPVGFLEGINQYLPKQKDNTFIIIEKTGHTYQQKEQEVADKILAIVKEWRA
ncbi:alpha/beta hydrolase [Veillonella sp. R32]|nr:alpha/beta hydrolase [Veillonella sp. R32]